MKAGCRVQDARYKMQVQDCVFTNSRVIWGSAPPRKPCKGLPASSVRAYV